MKHFVYLIALAALLGLPACSSTPDMDTSESTKSHAGGTPESPSRTSDPRFMTGASGRQDDFTPAAPTPLSLSIPTN